MSPEMISLLFFILLHLTQVAHQLDLDTCYQRLGIEDGSLPDSSLSASSSYDEASVGPQNARLHSDVSGGAWCPAKTVSRDTPAEYLEVDLQTMHVITATYTQGRFGNGRGQEYAEAYKIQYWRPGLTHFIDYHDAIGRKILPGNSNTYAVANNTLNPAIFASKIRLVPYSDHPRTVCMRIELVGCLFQEGVVAYSIPQGMVRGSMLELMDHTFDGHEDSLSGDLRGGLGQLVDGVYGWDNFKAARTNGHVKGYDWVGWKKKSNGETLDLVFTFDQVRTFKKVVIHINNHFTKDMQVFKTAKVYFSNEEDKFADDRVVDFSYMPDLAMENARNVTINLKEEHGQYVMLQLAFAAKWILISEITFFSEPRVEKLFVVNDQNDYGDSNFPKTTSNNQDILTNQNDDSSDGNDKKSLISSLDDIQGRGSDRMDLNIRNMGADQYVNEDDIAVGAEDSINIAISSPGHDMKSDQIERKIEGTEEEYIDSRTVGVIIGVLLTIISLLIGGILYVIYRNKRCSGIKSGSTPTHSLLTRKFTDRFSTSIDFKDMHIYSGTSNSNTTHNEFNGSSNLNGFGGAILPAKLNLKSSLTSSSSNCPPMYGHLVATSTRRMLDGDRSGSNQEETIYEEPLGSINQNGGNNHSRDDCIIGGTDLRPPAPPYSACTTGPGGITTSIGGFLSLNNQHRKFSSDPVLSEADYATDEYAEPGGGNYGGSGSAIGGNGSNSYSENIYAQALPVSGLSTSNVNIKPFNGRQDQMKPPQSSSAFGSSNRNLPPLPIAHYARPLSPPTMNHSKHPLCYGGPASTTSPDQMSTTTATPIIASADTDFLGLPSTGLNNPTINAIMFPPPPGTNPGSMVISGTTSTSASSSLGGMVGANGTLTRSVKSPPLSGVRSSATPSTTKSRRKMSGAGTNGSRTSSRKNSLCEIQKINKKQMSGDNTVFYASVDVSSSSHLPQQAPHSIDLAKLYAQIHKNTEPVLLNKPFTRSISIDTVNVELNEIPRSNLKLCEKLGEGQFGEIHLCQLVSTSSSTERKSRNDLKGATLVAVKSLRMDCEESFRSDFEHEARILTSLNDPNLVRVLGVCFEGDPACMICEYTEEGDLYQFLQDHVAETSLSKSPGVPTLSYGCLIYLATQIASGMKYLESLNFVHRDLATRNCLVGPRRTIKISDFGMSRNIYKNDYYKSQAGCLLPIRWMAWESVLLGKFTTKSDVWSFGVTMWEVLTFAREQPYESSSDEKVIANLSSLYSAGNPVMVLPPPFQCPREVRDLMLECWQRDENERPSFREIHLFLQRKNLGYNPVVSRDDGILTDDVEESYGEETSVTETDDDLNDRKQDFFEGESADGAEDEFSETDREYDQR